MPGRGQFVRRPPVMRRVQSRETPHAEQDVRKLPARTLQRVGRKPDVRRLSFGILVEPPTSKTYKDVINFMLGAAPITKHKEFGPCDNKTWQHNIMRNRFVFSFVFAGER